MADIYNPNKPKQDQEQLGQQQPAQGIQPISSGPTSNMGQSGASRTVSGSGGGGAQQQGSGAFTNFKKYIDANKDTNMGGQLAGEAQKKADAIQPEMGAAQEQVKQQLGAEQNRLGQYGQLSQQIQQDPTKLGQEQIGQFQQIYGGQAQTPNVDLSGIQQKAQGIQDIAKQGTTEQGRFGLLKQFYGTPQYTTGQQRLDQLLLQANPGQAKTLQSGLQNTAQQTLAALQGLQGQQTQAQQDIQNLAKQRQTEAQDLIGQEDTGSGLLGGLVNQIKGETTAKQGQADTLRNALSTALSGKGFSTPEEQEAALKAVQAAGIDPSQIKTYNIGTTTGEDFHPEQFLNNLNINNQTTANDQERARLNALYNIAGRQNTFLPDLGNQANAPGGLSSNIKDLLNTGALQNAGQEQQTKLDNSLRPYLQTQQQLTPLKDLTKQIWNLQAEEGRIPADSGISDIGTVDTGSTQKLVDIHNRERSAIESAVQQGLPRELADQLIHSDIIEGNRSGSGMHAAIPKGGDIFNQYMGQLSEAEKQIPALQKQYGSGNTLADLLSKYTTLPTQNTSIGQVPIATGGKGIGKIGLA